MIPKELFAENYYSKTKNQPYYTSSELWNLLHKCLNVNLRAQLFGFNYVLAGLYHFEN